MHGVQDDPAFRTLRGAVNARTTLEAGFTTVRNLGLMVKTGGYLLDVALQRAIDQGWLVGPADLSRPGTRSRPYGGHLDPDGVPAPRAGHHAAVASPRASPTASTRCGPACATRSGTAPS